MKQTYTIGDISSMLGIGIDAIRFYEKKGLVHPKKNPKNQYRVFTMYNILELLDVIYYRELGMTISEIIDILKSGTKESMQSLLREKRKKAQQRIIYERQMIRKIEHIEGAYQTIDKQYKIQLKEFPKTCIITRKNEKDEIMKSQIVDFNKDFFVMSYLYSTYNVQSDTIQDLYITMEQTIMEDFGISVQNSEILDLGLCIYTVIQLSGTTIERKDIQDLLDFALNHQLEYDDVIYIHEIPLTAYTDKTKYFAELYLPIKTK